MNKKKVLYIITKSNWGGAQRYVFDLVTNLPKDQFDVVVALGGTGQADALQGTLDSKLRAAGIRTLFVPSFMRDISVWREFSALRELIEIIRAERPDVVHLNSSKAGGVGALAARRARWPVPEGMRRAEIIFTSHGLAWDEDRNPLARAAIWFTTWVTFLLCDKIIVLSRDTYARAGRLPGCRKKLHLIHNGLGVLPLKNRDEARTALAIEVPVPVVGVIANLEWNKGLHYLVRAAGLLKRQGKSFLVCIVGEGEERKFLETLIEEEDVRTEVRLCGFKEEAWQYLQAFDLLALSSVKEGLPYVLIEAGQASLPVVASRIPGNVEIVGEGVSGLLFKPKNHHDFAAQLKKLLDDTGLREKLGKGLQERVRSEFSIEKMVRETTTLY